MTGAHRLENQKQSCAQQSQGKAIQLKDYV